MKKVFALCLLLPLLGGVSHAAFGGSGGGNLELFSDIVVRGTVVSLESTREKPRGIIYTDVEVKVEEYLKGFGGDSVTVRFVGGEVEGKGMLVGHMPRFRLGEEAVLYLASATTMPGDIQGIYEVVGFKEGKVSLSGGLEAAAPDVSGQSTGYRFLASHGGNYLRWSPFDIAKGIDFTISEWWLPVAVEPVGAVYAGFTAWEDVATASVDFDYRGTTTRQMKGEETGYNAVGWTAEAWVAGIENPMAAAVTYIAWYDTETLFFDEVDIAFNVGLQWSTTGEPNKYDIQGVATHEVGHLLGLAHTHPFVAAQGTVTTMIDGNDFWALGFNVEDTVLLRNLHKIDEQGISVLYPLNYPDLAIPPGPGGGCFIATAAYGSPLSGEVSILSSFRDRVISGSAPGRGLVFAYYRLSPALSEIISENSFLKSAIRLHLFPVISIIGMI